MATFIPGVTDTNLDPVLFTPDYSFLRYNLQQKTAQYQQGLQSVSSAYGALKKEMSDPTNVERRDNYLKAAESELQKIASADLSLQQNVNAANAIFDPIATDPAIAYDMYHTGRIKREMATMEGWAASDDMENRKKFNPKIYEWLKRDLDSLKNGNGDVSNYKVQGRKAWAYVDPLDLVNKMAKDMGFKVENDELGQPYIITTVDGKTNRESYEQFAKTVLQSNPVYQQQKAILSEAQVEEDLIRASADPKNAGKSREQLLTDYSSTRYDQGRERQNEYIKGLNDRLSTRTSEYQAYINQNAAAIAANPQGEQAQMATQMAQNLKQFKAQVDQVKNDYNATFGSDETSSAQKKKDFLKKFVEDPKSYYASQIEVEDIIKFSNLRSSFGSRSIKADQGYLGVLTAANRSLNTLINAADKQFDNEMDIAEFGLKATKLALQGKDKDGNAKKNADGTEKQADVEFVGTSSTQVNVTQKLNQLRERFEVNKTKAKAAMTSTYGGLYLLEKMGVASTEVSLVRGYMGKAFENPGVMPTKEESQALNRAYSTMFTWAKSSSNPNNELISTLRAAAQPGKTVRDLDFFTYLKMAAKNYVSQNMNEKQAIDNIAKYESAMAEVSRLNAVINKGVEVVVEQIKDDRNFGNLLVEENGKKRLLAPEDITKRMPSKGWREDSNWAIDPEVTLSETEKRDIANGIFEGRIKANVESYLKPGGKTGQNAGYGYRTVIDYQGRKLYMETSAPITPSSEEIQKGMKKINERVPIPVLESDQAGVMVTGSSAFIIRNQAKEDIRVKLTTPTQENSNILVSDGSGRLDGYTDASPAEQEAVRNAMANKENVEQIMLYTNSPLNGGSQLVEVIMKTMSGEKAPSWSGKRFYFPINVSQTSNETFRVFAQTDEMDEFMAYSKQNKPYAIDHFEGSGVKAEIIADEPGGRTGRVILKSKYDPVTKRYTDNWITNEMPFDLNKVTFTEVKEQIFNNFITPYMQGYMNNSRQAMNSVGAPGSSLIQQLQNVVTW